MRAALVWFRRDLRLDDHPALQAALRTGLPVVCLYVHAPDEEAPWAPGEASHWWLHHSLAALDADLRARGARLVVRRGPTTEAIDDLRARAGVTHVFWNRLYEPEVIARDQRLKAQWRQQGLEAESFNANLLFEPWTIATGSGDPYRVFTPFWRNARARLETAVPPAAPARIPAVEGIDGVPLDALGLLPRIPWDAGFREAWRPGEAGALELLDAFIEGALDDYATGRDLPDRAGTSRLSPHLHFGEISPRRIVEVLARRGLLARAEGFVRELGWREFGHHLLYHFPATTTEPLQPQFRDFPWDDPDPTLLAAWQRGRTGIPIVDAGMRELWTTGWMHNRVRMIVASLLTKNLRLHWLHGARWFWDTLVDADLANNTQGWQWTAGSGADAAPYFRIFNPVSQGERFDPEGRYVKRWVPELVRVPAKAVHQPWTLKPAERSALGLAGSAYPDPIVDLKSSREAALGAYQRMRGR
jgi:deoxyribodipyrimidine photo-lyase